MAYCTNFKWQINRKDASLNHKMGVLWTDKFKRANLSKALCNLKANNLTQGFLQLWTEHPKSRKTVCGFNGSSQVRKESTHGSQEFTLSLLEACRRSLEAN